jgi:hypothetical protein
MTKKYNYPEYSKEYYKKHREEIKKRRANLSKEDKQKLDSQQKEYQAIYRETHREYFKEKSASWRKTHPEYFKTGAIKEKAQKKHLLTYVPHKREEIKNIMLHPLYCSWARAKARAYKKNVPFTISIWDIEIPETCPYLGVPLTGKGPSCYNTPSIDRIIPSLGYIPGNIEVVSMLANRMKNNATIGQLVTFAKAVLEKFEDQCE